MTQVIEQRLSGLEDFISKLVAQAEKRKKFVELQKEIAETVIGMPYYWHDWKGSIVPHTKPTKVTAVIVNQKTNETCHWHFDSDKVVEQVKYCSQFNSYEEYIQYEKDKHKQEIISILTKYNYSETEIQNKLKEYNF